MILFFIITIFFYITKAIHDDELFVFNKDEIALSECIEYNLLTDDESFNKDPKVTEGIADLIARRFSGKILKITDLNKRSIHMYYYLKTKKLPTHELYGLRVIREALVYCADDGFKPDKIYFDREPHELANVLNYILVDWPFPFEEMIHWRKGRMILRSFAEEAQAALDTALTYLNNPGKFRDVIREVWTRRAQFYFDGRNYRFPYIRHHYTLKRGLRIRNIQNGTRITQSVLDLYPKKEGAVVDKLIYIHTEDFYNEHDIFCKYKKSGMKLPEYFIETHIDQFYRILIFFMESQLRGIATFESDIYYGSRIPYEILQKEFQNMLYDNYVYLKIIKDTRECLGKVLMESPLEIGLILSSPRIFKKYEKLLLKIRSVNNFTVTTSTPEIGSNLDLQYYQQSTQLKSANTYNYDCVLEKYFKTYNGPSNRLRSKIMTKIQFNPRSVPDFSNEPLEIGFVLDYILVNWSLSLRDMIHTRTGRITLRRYAEDALLYFQNAINSVISYDYFRHSLRSLWMLRAQRFYDGYDSKVPYLRHLYTLRHSFPHTYDDQKTLLPRSNVKLFNRNPVMPQALVDKLLNIHVTNRSHHNDENVFYSFYLQYGMTSSEYYIETHIDQFYRIIFFYLELKLYGIQSDQDDIWDGPLPYVVVPDFIQKIIYNDLSYRNFLSFEHRRLEKIFKESKVANSQNWSGSFIYEEYLISALNSFISHSLSYENIPLTTTSTTSELNFVSSTTPKINQVKRKGSVWANEKGKHFLKRPKGTFPDSCCDHVYENSDGGNFRMHTESCLDQYHDQSVFPMKSMIAQSSYQLKTDKRFYGYVVYDDRELSIEKAWSIFLNNKTNVST